MIFLESYWVKKADISCCGYLHSADGGVLSGESLSEYFVQFADEAALRKALQEANGCFALIRNFGEKTLAAVDRTRSFPLFWDTKNRLADKNEKLKKLDIQALQASAPEIISEYLICGYVSGSDTLHPEIKQIPAGHYLVLESDKAPRLECYYRREHLEMQGAKAGELALELHALHLKIAEEIAHYLDGRTAVIPLSGGYDSRLIAYLLSVLAYPKVICFSYDSPTSRESHISQATAKYLKLPWHFVEHTHQSWYEAYQSPERRDFYRYAVNASSSAHIQDWLAVKELKAQGILPEDSVFMPGHTGDFLQSGHLGAAFGRQESFGRQELIDQIIARHYRLWQNPSPDEYQSFGARIQKVIAAPERMDAAQAASLYEYWNLQERQAKFILNSLRVYEYFGYEWHLFHWDQRLMDFWAKVPLEQRLGRRLWQHYAKEYLPIPLPVFKVPYLGERIVDKALRILYGEIRNVRYGRFAPYHNFRQYASEKVQNYLREDLKYPSFVQPDKPLIRCDMNAVQALASLFEAGSTRKRANVELQ